MLRVSLLGNLGADPETRYTNKGVAIVSFRVAINQVRVGPDGERQENTEWFRVRVSGRQTDYVQKFGKGTRVFVAGRLDIGHYQSREGEQRTSFEVWADEVVSLTPRPSAAPDGTSTADSEVPEAPLSLGFSSLAEAAPAARAGAQSNGSRPRSARPAAASLPEEGTPDDLEDLPF
jgi:single-strand DNA-binding protein